MSQIIIHYHRFNDSQESIVRVKLSAASDVIEWDVFFSRLSADEEADVTVNWRSLDINSNGVFYTDVNAY
jgi:Ni,Fe-hydrogenase III large subunit